MPIRDTDEASCVARKFGVRGKIKEGTIVMDFSAFDTGKLKEYAERAKASWGDTPEYREFEKRNQGRSAEDQQKLLQQMMHLFMEFGQIRSQELNSSEAQGLVKKLQTYISDHFYVCTNQILAGLGMMYGSGGEFTENINKAAGEGVAEYVSEAIRIYCGE